MDLMDIIAADPNRGDGPEITRRIDDLVHAIDIVQRQMTSGRPLSERQRHELRMMLLGRAQAAVKALERLPDGPTRKIIGTGLTRYLRVIRDHALLE